jgi:4-carboxymuconolactone decarboxylase
MAPLPDPRPHADAETLAEMQRIAAARSHAEGRAELGSVYVAMFNNPGVARAVATLGERLRFEGALPDWLRELAVLRYAARARLEYVWAHHVRPAKLAGVSEDLIAMLAARAVPAELDPLGRAVVEAVDHVAENREIPDPVQRVLAEAIGLAGVVELVAVCGIYALMGHMTTAFAIQPETGFPALPV